MKKGTKLKYQNAPNPLLSMTRFIADIRLLRERLSAVIAYAEKITERLT